MKKKLRLDNIKVNSFITEVKKEEIKKIIGGGPETLILCSVLCTNHQSICNATRNAC